MKPIRNLGASLALLAIVAIGTGMAADKEVVLKGKISCAKCELKLDGVTKCQTAIKVKEDGKDVTYFFLDKGNQESWHEAVCGGGKKDGSVTGVVVEKGGKKWIKPSKVTYAEKQATNVPMWHGDYAAGLKCSREEHKPLAVFVGCGSDGWLKVVRGSKPSAELERILSEEFVCVYVDADTPAGKRMASMLKVSEDMGLVLGDRNGEYIDHRHVGSMSEDDLSHCLSRCCGMTTNGHGGQGTSHGSTNGSMGAAMQAPAVGSCCRGR